MAVPVTRPEPVRTCVSCRQHGAKTSFLRVVRLPDRHVVIDPTGSLEGRGAYVCVEGECRQTAVRRSALERALRTSLPIELKLRLEHGDAAATGSAGTLETPAMFQGGTHGA